MGAHRAHRRGLRRTPSVNPSKPPVVPAEAPVRAETAGRRAATRRSATRQAAPEPVAPMPAVALQATPGRRKAARHSGRRGRLIPGLPPLPVAVGVAALAISAGGAITVANPALVSGDQRVTSASAVNGTTGATSSTSLLNDRTSAVSRDSRRDALEDAADQELVDMAEQQARERNAALAKFAKQAEAQAAKIALNQWVLPVDDYHLTAGFGDWGLWASYHTGLDFAGDYGAPIKAMANGDVTEVGYDGSYGNKVVITLDDGTELWFCHMSEFATSTGEEVRAGEVIGYIGSTGNTTGPHLHLEVRPGAGDPVDPYAAMLVHGLQP
jgi:murein DD-endopeptidase MepM/ murein hydrolase activator NlpD